MSLFVVTYSNEIHCEVSKKAQLLGFRNENTGTLGSLRRIGRGTRILLRDSSKKNRMTFFGLFEASDCLLEVDSSSRRIWPDERTHDRVIYNLRIPAKFIRDVDRSVPRQVMLRLGWTKRYPPYNAYNWSGLAKLCSGNFLEEDQEEQLLQLLDLLR